MAIRGKSLAVGLIERFTSSYKINQSNGCWDILLVPNKSGYGKIKFMGKTLLTHRVSYELFNGSIPNGRLVCHKCDNPSCVNPEHLFLGSPSDNMNDKIIKGRHKGAKSGENHHLARLTRWQVNEIREKLKKGYKQSVLAAEYSVSKTIISNIKTGKRWKNER